MAARTATRGFRVGEEREGQKGGRGERAKFFGALNFWPLRKHLRKNEKGKVTISPDFEKGGGRKGGKRKGEG